MNKRHYEHTFPNIRGSLSNTYLVPYLCHMFYLLNGIFKIATNGRNFLCCQAKQGVSVYRNITLLS